MINIYHLIDTLPPLLGSIVTLWAVCSPRHWFLRSIVIAASLLLFLLVPAYELVVAGSVQVAIIVGGMKLWQRQRNWKNRVILGGDASRRTQISLRNMLLFTVLVATTMAVLASFPALSWRHWLAWTGPGIAAGCITLLCVWLVLGNASRRIRIVVAIVFGILTALGISLVVVGLAIIDRTTFSQQTVEYLLAEITPAWRGSKFWHYGPAVGIGMAVLCTWIYLFVRTGWFDPFGEVDSGRAESHAIPRRIIAARWAWTVLTAAIVVLPVILLVKLISPTPRPEDDGLVPGYFEHFHEAGEMIDPKDVLPFPWVVRLPTDKLTEKLAGHAKAFERMRQAFGEKVNSGRIKEDSEAIRKLAAATSSQLELAKRLKSPEKILEAARDKLLLHDLYFGNLSDIGTPSDIDLATIEEVWKIRGDMSEQQLRSILQLLVTLEAKRQSWSEVERLMTIEDENSNWQTHLHVIGDRWHGKNRYSTDGLNYLINRLKIRMMIMDLAIIAYQKATGQLPEKFEDLASDLLAELPIDPDRKRPLKYRLTNKGYEISSIGHNAVVKDGSPTSDELLLQDLVKPAMNPVP